MIRWCSYCQQFMGEIEPYDDFRLSHGVCRSCAANLRNLRYNKLQGVAEFFRMLFSSVESGQALDARNVIRDASEIGISRADLLLGILQPILYRIGLYFAEGKISVAKEHLFSEAVHAITQEFENTPSPETDPSQLKIMLALSEHNIHHLGLDFLCLLIAEKLGCRVRKLKHLSTEEMAELIIKERPTVFGLSAALPEQWLAMIELNHLLHVHLAPEEKPLLALGGASLKSNAAKCSIGFVDFTANCYDSMATIEFLRKRVCLSPDG